MKFYIDTLGCKVNTYESNVMRFNLLDSGYIESTSKDADIIIINTCSVTNMADKKSAKMLRHYKSENANAILIVCGCSTQNNFKNYLDADIILGNRFKSKIVDYIEAYLKDKKQIIAVESVKKIPFEAMALDKLNQTRAFIKIQDGCNNFCSYCIIPYLRGDVRSKNIEDVLSEVNNLVLNGYKEIVLTGIHTGLYGREFGLNLNHLLKELVKINGLERIRISSIEIVELDDEFIELLKNEVKIVSHIHIPLQSGSNHVLKQMNRRYDKEKFMDILNKIKKARPLISITTDVIVGFPNETEQDFKETIDTIKKCGFSKIHVFPYSKREGTKAALMDGEISEEIKKRRVKELLELSETLEKEYMSKYIGKEVIVLPEVIDGDYLIGHTDNYLLVKFKGCKKDLNNFVKVNIKSLLYPFLTGDIANEK